jgi:hypothetical protein
MSAHHQHGPSGPGPAAGDGFWRSRAGIAFTVFAVAAAVYLLFEHRLHLLGALPWLLLLLCPLMHLFMHGGHGGHGGSPGGRTRGGGGEVS